MESNATLTDAVLLANAAGVPDAAPVTLGELLTWTITDLHEREAPLPARLDVERSVNRLLEWGLITVDGDEARATAAGSALCGPVRRKQRAGRVDDVHRALLDLPPATAPPGWTIGSARWSVVVNGYAAEQRAKLEERAAILDALLSAIARMHEVSAAVHRAPTQAAAVAALEQALGFDETQAQAVLAMPVGRQAGDGRAEFEEMRADVDRALAELDALG